MISWWWLIPTFVCGGIIGFFVVLCVFVSDIKSSWH